MRYEKELDTVLEEIVARWGIPGLGVGIVEGDEIVYARSFGVQSLDTGAPLGPDTIFCVASITKCFVATAVMQLVERGLVDLDSPLVRFLPTFALDDERSGQITIRQVLSHTAGLPDLGEDEYDELVSHPNYDDGALERTVRALKDRKLAAPPGERFLYSNLGYDVLGHLIARVSGQSFEAYMKEQVLLPAGMTESTLSFVDVPRDRLAVPHLRTPQAIVSPFYPYHRGDAPASFLHATVRDMCAWGTTCLKQGKPGRRALLTPASYDLMWTPVAEWGFPPFYEHIGLGWTLGHFDGLKTVSHGGMGFGWSCFFTVLPERDRAAILLSNEESFARARILRAVVHAMLEKEPQAGSVSWMIPITQALAEGGIRAAYEKYEQIKQETPDEYFFDPDDLINLMVQVRLAGKIDLAVEVLELNLHAFPENIESHLELAKIHLKQGEAGRARAILSQAKEKDPGNAAVTDLLDQVERT